jgi:hypothetical protein
MMDATTDEAGKQDRDSHSSDYVEAVDLSANLSVITKLGLIGLVKMLP